MITIHGRQKRQVAKATLISTTATPLTAPRTIYSTPQQLQQQKHNSMRIHNPANIDLMSSQGTQYYADIQVTNMLSLISTQISGLSGEMANLCMEMQNYNQKLDGAFFQLNEQQVVLEATMDRHNECTDHVDLLMNIAIQQEKQIDNLKDRLDKMEGNASKKNILTHGVEESPSEDIKQVVQNFINVKMEIPEVHEVGIRDAYRLGRGENRPIKVQLANVSDKITIFKHAKYLKGKKNTNKKTYFIQNDLPEKQQEEDKWQRRIFNKNKKNCHE